jgi:guanylate cyclase
MDVVTSAVEVHPGERLPAWLRRAADAGLAPGDDPDLRLRKRMLLLVVLFTTTTIAVLLLATLAPGDPRSAAVPLLYFVVSLLGIAHLVRTKRIELLLYSQLVMVLVLPAVQQWLLGGFVASAASVLYSMNAAVLAVVLVGPRRARWWFVAFAAVVVLSGLLDGWLVRTVESPDVPIVLFFVVTIIGVGLIVWLPLAFFVEARRRLVVELDRTIAELDRERQRSETLLLTILPAQIAQRLKDGEHPIADRYDEVAVLFADIVAFTPTSARLDPAEVIAGLNQIFTAFDRLAAEEGLEKVKTIGDAYMVVGGAPQRGPDPVARVTRMAVRMQLATEQLTFGGQPLVMRIGVDVGPVVAGVIGEAKFAWDLYGDVVNTAARMESHGVPGRVQMTQRFRDRLPDGYQVQERGPVEVKGKGALRTYLLAETSATSSSTSGETQAAAISRNSGSSLRAGDR